MLRLLDKIYGGVIGLRNTLYDRGVCKIHNLGVRTISIGNLTVGGTGKTPLVIRTAEILAERGEKVAILTRGYKRSGTGTILVSDGRSILSDARTAGDEAFEIAGSLNGKVIVVSDPDRVSAAKWAVERFDVTVFILDDGFQHRRAGRDLNIVCIDATSPAGGKTDLLNEGHMLPSGRFREPIESLKRADVVVITRADLSDNVEKIKKEIEAISPDIPIFASASRIVSLEEKGSGKTLVPSQAGALFAFCGVGNPNGFFLSLENAGVEVKNKREFRDHHGYTEKDLNDLVEAAEQNGAVGLVTTVKDAVKISAENMRRPLYSAIAEICLDEEERFVEML